MDTCKEIKKTPKSLFTVVNYSAGRQSEWFLESILRGEIKVHLPHVLNANPGMERSSTLERVSKMKERCDNAGIYFETVDGPNLYEDLISGNCREHPPYFTEEGGKIGHHCTREYKIRPIRRAIRRIIRERFFMKSTFKGMVDSLICFSADEERRVKDSSDSPQYETQRYPLIEMGVTTDQTFADFERWGVTPPLPSLCNGCFAHGLRSLSQLSGRDLVQAEKVDEAIRDEKFSGLKTGSLYINSSRKSVKELREAGFDLGDIVETDRHRCNSGVCFL